MRGQPSPEASATEPEAGTGETAILTIDLNALTANYRRLRDLAAPAECAAVVKADAYGLGVAEVAPALWRTGCRSFFVATPAEAKALRGLLPKAAIYVFAGLLPGTADAFREMNLRPVLNSADEIKEWAALCLRHDRKLPCAVHIDSGMNRLGLSADEVARVSDASELWASLTLSLVLSHLACADDPDHAKNAQQRQAFNALRACLPAAPASLANSAGILLGRNFIYDLARPGIALYGGHPRRRGDNPFQPVAHLEGRILQIRNVSPGQTIGYGAARSFDRPARVAIVAAGYADGFFRSLSTKDGEEGLPVYVGPHAAPVIGRVSMDLISVDVTDVPETAARRGEWIELLGPNVTAQAFAAHAGTIDYEVLTRLGRRASRRYIGG
ncbi:MAG: alanine racemase [Methyloceanibacter sp.]